jgi:hypothetical protein
MASEPASNASQLVELVRYALPAITALFGTLITGLLAIWHQRIREDREDRRSHTNHQRELQKLAEKTTDKRENRKYAEAKKSIIEHASAATGLFDEALTLSRFFIQQEVTSAHFFRASEEFDRARTRFSDAEARLKFILPPEIEDKVDIVGQSARVLSDPKAERSTRDSNELMTEYGNKTRELHDAVHGYLDLLNGEHSQNAVSNIITGK